MPTALFTPETAREYGRRGNAAKAILRAAARESAALATQAASEPAYLEKVKARARAQVLVLLTRIEEESAKPKIDGGTLDRLASALERLAELERVLDGRPSPGTRRPAPEVAPDERRAPRAVPQSPIPSQGVTGPVAALPSPGVSAPPPPRLADPPEE